MAAPRKILRGAAILKIKLFNYLNQCKYIFEFLNIYDYKICNYDRLLSLFLMQAS